MRKTSQPKPQPPSAAIAMMRAEIDDLPFGAVGEVAAPEPQPQPAPMPPAFVIPAPDWGEEERERLEREAMTEAKLEEEQR